MLPSPEIVVLSYMCSFRGELMTNLMMRSRLLPPNGSPSTVSSDGRRQQWTRMAMASVMAIALAMAGLRQLPLAPARLWERRERNEGHFFKYGNEGFNQMELSLFLF